MQTFIYLIFFSISLINWLIKQFLPEGKVYEFIISKDLAVFFIKTLLNTKMQRKYYLHIFN